MSVLLSSAGRRVELTRAFKRAHRELGLDEAVVASDMNPLAPALHEANRRYVVPPSNDPGYVSSLIEICRKEQPKLVFPMIDPDIPLLARHRADFDGVGARVMVAPEESVDVAADKWKTFEFFTRIGVPTIETKRGEDVRPETMEYPLFLKPRYGSASEQTFVARTRREFEFFLDYIDDPIVQPSLKGFEITSDVISDLESNVLCVVQRRRIATRSGEVAKGVTVRDEDVERNCVRIAEALSAIGPINVQCFMTDGGPVFTEINCRFGGGSPLAIRAGADFPKWLVALGEGLEVDIPALGSYTLGLYLTRFDESFFLAPEDYERVAGRRI